MATYGWGTNSSVIAFLKAQAHRFSFYQAVKILEILAPDKTSVGVSPDPSKEAVRFQSRIGMDFPPSELEFMEHGANGSPTPMSVNFMGLAGANSPLPAAYTEFILTRLQKRDTAIKSFLDIFNHRLVSILYRIRKKHHIGFEFTPPCNDFFSEFLFSLKGMGTPALRNRMQVKDRALLFYTGLINQQPHSMVALESILGHYFRFRVKGEHFRGQWYKIEPDQFTYIGRTGQNQVLGQSAVLGTRVWDRQGKFRLHVGPLSLKQYVNILPIGNGYTPLCQLTRFFVGNEFDFDFKPIVKAAEIPESCLGGEYGPRLGWTAWLKTKDFKKDDTQVRLTLRSGAFIFRDRKEI